MRTGCALPFLRTRKKNCEGPKEAARSKRGKRPSLGPSLEDGRECRAFSDSFEASPRKNKTKQNGFLHNKGAVFVKLDAR